MTSAKASRLQIAAYAEAVTELYGIKDPSLVFLFAETEPPYDTRWITPDLRMVGTGSAAWYQACTSWLDCLRSGNWPGRPDATLGPSKWRDWKEQQERQDKWLNT